MYVAVEASRNNDILRQFFVPINNIAINRIDSNNGDHDGLMAQR